MTPGGDDSPAFERASACLEAMTSMTRSEARGTLRITLREAGFDPKRVSPREIEAVASAALPDALRVRGVRDAREVCRRLGQQLAGGMPASVPGDAARQARPSADGPGGAKPRV